jgi:hypothetical protein
MTIAALAKHRLGDEGVRREEATELRIVNSPLHVHEAELVLVVVAREAAGGGRGRGDHTPLSPDGVSLGAEGVIAAALHEGACRVGERVCRAEVVSVQIGGLAREARRARDHGDRALAGVDEEAVLDEPRARVGAPLVEVTEIEDCRTRPGLHSSARTPLTPSVNEQASRPASTPRGPLGRERAKAKGMGLCGGEPLDFGVRSHGRRRGRPGLLIEAVLPEVGRRAADGLGDGDDRAGSTVVADLELGLGADRLFADARAKRS